MIDNEIEKLRDMGKVKNLIDDLGCDYQRMSLGGQETYKKLCKLLGWEFESWLMVNSKTISLGQIITAI